MIRILLSFLLLEVSFCNVSVSDESSNSEKSKGKPSSFDDLLTRRYVRDLAGQKKFGEKGNYVTTVIFVDLPTFSDSIDVGDVFDHADKFNIQYNQVQFSKLSSAYSLAYRIDLSANVVQLILRLGKAQIRGTYSATTPSYSSTTPSTPREASQDFELNLYSHLMYTHKVLFEVDKNGKASFGKTENPRLLYKKVEGNYTNPPSSLAADLENYLDPNLLKAVVAKIYDEVVQKVSLTDVGYQINNEISYKRRDEIADLLLKAIATAFEDVRENAYNVLFSDRTNFNPIIHNFDVKIPSFVVRNIDRFEAHDMKISFVGDDVRVWAQNLVSSPLALLPIVYRSKYDVSAQNRTVKAEYQLSNFTFELEVTINPETNAVEFGEAVVKVADAKVASTQGLYGDERDSIIQQLTPYIKSFVQENASRTFAGYVKGLSAEGGIAHQVLK